MSYLKDIEKTYLNTYFLHIFQNLKENMAYNCFLELLKTLIKEKEIEKNIEAFCKFVYEFENLKQESFCSLIKSLVFQNQVNCNNSEQIEKELEIINNLVKIDYSTLQNALSKKYKKHKKIFELLPKFKSGELKLTFEDLKNSKTKHHDILEKHQAFVFNEAFEIIPIKIENKINFSNLKGYNEQKRILKENTSALMNNKKVNNILLYGDSGCGKSSSVRALLEEFSELKIVQVFKNNLVNLDKLFIKLKNLPYKFIIFLDDISFSEDDKNLSTFKAIIEGSLIECPNNVALYATSNRKNLIKETFSSRSGDEIHLVDTLNETNSLCERFGINLIFLKPNNKEFEEIVLELAKDYNINLDEKILLEKAKRHAILKGSRSPRIIKQLIENLACKIDI